MLALLLALVICHQSYAQSRDAGRAQSPDRLIEAHRYEIAAKQEMEKNCSLATAKTLIEKAIQTGRSFQSANQIDRDMMGAFLGETEVLRIEIVGRQKAADKTAGDAEVLLKQHRIASASNLAESARFPGCEERFKNLTARIQQANTQSDDLMRQGDEIVDTKPLKAMSLYQQARDINVEVANFDQRMDAAKATQKRLHVTTAGHKILIWIVLIALIGGLAYAASKAKKTQGGS
jgi:hypothetical protein